MILTPEIIKSFDPCPEGYKRFLQLLPNGGTLDDCINALVNDGHDEWGMWLFKKCQNSEEYRSLCENGYRNSGSCNSGSWNSGSWNSGYQNSGSRNSGSRNSGNGNSGSWNSGSWNSGYQNSGSRNSGNGNSGDCNSGSCNSGSWNSGNRNSGFFNTITPDFVFIFNKLYARSEWESCIKPKFIYFNLNIWINEDDMTNEEKTNNPQFYIAGGYLKSRTYREAWRKSWDEATKEDRELILQLPNFDADIFLEISGIDVKKELNLDDKHLCL